MNDDDNPHGGQNGEEQVPKENPLRVVNDEYDAYDFTGGGDGKDPYDRERFYTQSRDKNGDKESIRVQFPGKLKHQIDALIASRDIPEYQTPQDFVRDSIMHQAVYVANLLKDKRFTSRINSVIMAMDMEKHVSDMEASHSAVTATEALLARASDIGDWIAVGLALETGFMHLEALREPYQTKLRELLRKYEIKYNENRRPK